MPSYNSTARVPFAKGGKVDKKPKPKRIILWKGKVKDWPGAQKAKERTGKEHGGKIEAYKKEQERKGILKKEKKWIASPGKRRKPGKRQRTIGKDRKINPEWLKEKYNVDVKEREPRRKTLAVTDKYKKIRDSLGLKKGGFPIRTSKLKRGADQEFTLQKGVSAAPIKQSKAASLKEHAKTWPPKGMTIKKDSQKAFEGAIKKGLKNPKDYMYMHTKGGKDFFKHIGTRKYESFKKGGEVGLDDYKKGRLSKWLKKFGTKGLRPQAKAEGGIISLKKGGKADKKWIQKATKGMRKDKPCTGKKFGSATCPPGSKRYNLAQTFKKMARSKHASGGLVRFI